MTIMASDSPLNPYQQLLDTRRALLPTDIPADAAPTPFVYDLYPGLRNWRELMDGVARVLSRGNPTRVTNITQAQEVTALKHLLAEPYRRHSELPVLTPLRNAMVATVSEHAPDLAMLLKTFPHRQQWTRTDETRAVTAWAGINTLQYWEDICNGIALACLPELFDAERIRLLFDYGQAHIGQFDLMYMRALTIVTDTVKTLPRLRHNLHANVDIS